MPCRSDRPGGELQRVDVEEHLAVRRGRSGGFTDLRQIAAEFAARAAFEPRTRAIAIVRESTSTGTGASRSAQPCRVVGASAPR